MSAASTGQNSDATQLVTVVIPIRNEEAAIGQCLEGLLRQDYPPAKTEIVVIDGNSSDKTALRVQAVIDAHPDRDITLLHNPEGIVPSSLNLAIASSRGEIIVRMDGHAVMADDYVSQSVQAIIDHDADVVGGPLETIGVTPFGKALAYAQSSPAGIGNSHFRYSKRAAEVPTVGFGTFRRSAFARVGLFDESMVRGQDYELNVRIRNTGGRIYLDPRIKASYQARSSPSGVWSQHFQYGWWRVETLRRHPDSARPNHVLPFTLVAGLLLPIPLLRTRLIRRGWAALVATYVTFVGVGSASQLKRGAKGKDLPSIMVAIVFMQCGYGLGSLVNIVTNGRWPYGPVEPSVPMLGDAVE